MGIQSNKEWKRQLLILLTLSALSGPTFADALSEADAAYNSGDYKQALKLLRPLAAQKKVTAQFNLGLMYANGQGVIQDYQEAEKWYRLAATQGYAPAQLRLGLVYANGQGVIQDYQEAEKWYRLAASQGYAPAQFNLGLMYLKGRDYVYAHKWFNLAAAGGHGLAARNRDNVTDRMTSSQIAEAQYLARECEKSKYKKCD